MKVLIVVEQTATGFSAYSPDIDACVASGATRDEVEQEMRKAIEFHFDSLRDDGQQVPEPHSYATFVEVAA